MVHLQNIPNKLQKQNINRLVFMQCVCYYYILHKVKYSKRHRTTKVAQNKEENM